MRGMGRYSLIVSFSASSLGRSLRLALGHSSALLNPRSPSRVLFHNNSRTEQSFTIFSLTLGSIATLDLNQCSAISSLTLSKNSSLARLQEIFIYARSNSKSCQYVTKNGKSEG